MIVNYEQKLLSGGCLIPPARVSLGLQILSELA